MEQTINGYHIFSLPSRESEESISFSCIENEMGEGYEASRLIGLNTGNRKFALNFPALKNYAESQTYELDGVLYTPAAYLSELFARQKTEGKLFAIQSLRNNQYYLCKFSDNKLTQQGIYVALFKSSALFQQVRKRGVTVFDVSKIRSVFAEYDFGLLAQSDGSNITDITDSSGNSRTATVLGDVGTIEPLYKTNQQNGRGVARFTNTGGAETWSIFRDEPFTFYWALIVSRYDGATFADYNGALSALTSNTIFVGNSGGSIWFDQSYSNVYFSQNGTAYPQTAMPAPMNNAFTISFIQVPGGIAMDGLQIGRDRDFAASRTWKGDIAHVIVGNQPLAGSELNELIEHIKTLWAL